MRIILDKNKKAARESKKRGRKELTVVPFGCLAGALAAFMSPEQCFDLSELRL